MSVIHNTVTRVYDGHNVTRYPQYLAITKEVFNHNHDRLEVVGTAQVKVTRKNVDGCVNIELFDGDNGTDVGSSFNLIGAAVDDTFYTAVKNYACTFAAAATSKTFAHRLSLWEYAHIKMITDLAHWFQTDSTGVIRSTVHGIEDIDTFALSVSLIDDWWSTSVKIVQTWHPDVNVSNRGLYLDAIGMAALCIATGPYTTVEDRRDTRNDQFDSFFDRGDCDKNAISGAALFTLMMKMTASDITHINSALAHDIIVHWQQTRGEAIILHLKTDTKTALGESGGAVDPSSWYGHCTLMITEKDWAPNKPLTQSLFGEMTRATAPHIPRSFRKQCTFEQIYYKNYNKLNTGTAQQIAGQGEIKVLDPNIYPMVAQFLTSTACYIFKAQGKDKVFPSLKDIMTKDWPYVQLTQVPKSKTMPPNMVCKSIKDLAQIMKPRRNSSEYIEGFRLINPKSEGYVSQVECRYGPIAYGLVQRDTAGNWHAPPEHLTKQPTAIGCDHCQLSTRVVGYDN